MRLDQNDIDTGTNTERIVFQIIDGSLQMDPMIVVDRFGDSQNTWNTNWSDVNNLANIALANDDCANGRIVIIPMNCIASSELNEESTCDQAFPLSEGDWASNGEGIDSWIVIGFEREWDIYKMVLYMFGLDGHFLAFFTAPPLLL